MDKNNSTRYAIIERPLKGDYKSDDIILRTVDQEVTILDNDEKIISKFTLPKDADPNDLEAFLNEDNVLCVKAQLKQKHSSKPTNL